MSEELENRFDEIALRKELAKVNKLIAKHDAKREALWKHIRENCPHTNVKAMHSYTPGGYLDTGWIEDWNECVLCHAKSKVISRSDGSYG